VSEATLSVSCPDRKGLVAALSMLLYTHGANILQSQQHVDRVESRFFERIQFDLAELDISRTHLEELLRIECGRYDMDWRISYSNERHRVAIFVSKIEHCLWDLLIRHRLGELPCDIALIVSNHADLEQVAQQFGVPYHVFPITKQTKRVQEDAECALLEDADVDVIVLARYMQVLSDEFIERYPQQIINIHHSFLPAFVGSRPYQQAYERGVKNIGATAHYATSELDEGPILAQDVVACSHRDTVDDLVRKGRDVERVVLARGVRAHLEDRVLVHGRRTVVF
jgi:formyltetrahydrofolate deformylase